MTIRIVMDGQFGSCGKGAIVSALGKEQNPAAIVRVGGPQAGHSMLGPCPPGCLDSLAFEGGHLSGEHHWKMRMIPCGWHLPNTQLFIGRGTMVNLEVLHAEIREVTLTMMGVAPKLWVDANAFIVDPQDIETEEKMSMEAGSTREGVGAARARSALRLSRRVGDAFAADEVPWLAPFISFNTAMQLRSLANPLRTVGPEESDEVWIEGTQGFGLSLRASGHYPSVTSQDITPQQMLADTGLHWDDGPVDTMMLLRTFPIRIAGNSGALDEIDWKDLPVPPAEPETTTVTKKVRRIGRFDWKEAQAAVNECRPTSLVLTFLDYLPEEKQWDFVAEVQSKLDTSVSHVSLGFEKVMTLSEFRRSRGLQSE